MDEEEIKPLSQYYELFNLKKSAHKITISLRYKWEDPRWQVNVRGSTAIIIMGLNAVADAAVNMVVDTARPTFLDIDRGIACSIFHSDGEISIPSLPLNWLDGAMLQWHIEMSDELLDIDDTFKFEFRF